MTPEATFLQPDPSVEAAVRTTGEELFRLMDAHPSPGILSRKGAYARIMEWSMKDPAFKAQLFRFVDVLPSLGSSSEIVRHLQEYLGDKAVELNPAMRTGLAAAAFAPALVAGPVKANVTSMAGQFVAGATPEDLVKRLRANAAAGVATTIDLLGETVVSTAEADAFLRRNLDVLDTVGRAMGRDAKPCFSDMGPKGPLPRLNLSVKVSALTPEVHPADPGRSISALKERLRPILRRAAEIGAFINFDMESYGLKDLTLSLFRSILSEDEFRERPAIGIAMQAYLRDCERDLRELIAWARKATRPIVVRLVKGAYWDYETILAGQRGWPVPVWAEKPESDANYEKLSVLLLENADIAAPAFASHNVRSCAHAIAQAERLGVDPRAYEFQALYGMADELKSALVASGRRVREYCPVGDLLPGMAYLVRRLLENTSNEGFLRAKDVGGASREALLQNPTLHLRARGAPPPPPPPRVPERPQHGLQRRGQPRADAGGAGGRGQGPRQEAPDRDRRPEDLRPRDDRVDQSRQARAGRRALGAGHRGRCRRRGIRGEGRMARLGVAPRRRPRGDPRAGRRAHRGAAIRAQRARGLRGREAVDRGGRGHLRGR
jgi:RHH-type proline utilization regulon transcriptional repressor/proline dehydrogenase/delta 1-pyrroline-5-carboxylate dehydrogenase